MAAADEAKAKGNTAYSGEDFTSAVKYFSDAIALSPTPNHLLFSNRSAAYSMRSQYTRALRDAEKTISLRPDWAKAHYRLGVAHAGLHNFTDAVSAYNKGLQLDPYNPGVKSALSAAEKAAAAAAVEKATGVMDRSGPFSGPGMWTALEADWRSRELLNQKDFVKKLKKIQRNQQTLDLKDHRFACAVSVLMSAGMRRSVHGDEEDQLKTMTGEVGDAEESEVIENCDTTVERGGVPKLKLNLATYSEDFAVAVKKYKEMLIENPHPLKRLEEAENEKKKMEQEECFDPKSDKVQQ